MAHIIDKAHIKQHSLVVMLLDLKDAFGKLHHNINHMFKLVDIPGIIVPFCCILPKPSHL